MRKLVNLVIMAVATLAGLCASVSVVRGVPLNFQAGQETPLDVGTLGGVSTVLLSQNNAGQAAGYSYPFVASNIRHAVLWDPIGGLQNIGTPGTAHGFAMGINDAGTVVGYGQESNNTGVAFIWDSAGGMRSLPTLGGSLTAATDVNNSTEVAGYAIDSSGRYRAFLWNAADGIQDIGTLGGPNSLAWGINDLGVVTGEAEVSANDWHAFLYTEAGGMVDLGFAGVGFGINEAGVVAGAYAAPGGEGHAFLWDGLVFYTNFENGLEPEITSPKWQLETIDSGADGSYGTRGFSGNQFYRSPDKKGTNKLTVSLSGLPAHTGVDLNFLLASIDKTSSDDTIQVSIDGVTIFSEAIAFDGSGWNPGAPIEMFSNLRLGYVDVPQGYDKGLDFGRVGSSDHSTAVDFSNIPHSASTLVLEIEAATSQTKRSYAIDDLSIIVTPPSVLDLGTLGGTSSGAYAVNEEHQAVGTSVMPDGTLHGFVWDPNTGVMTDLNDYLLPGSGYVLQQARGINAAGDVLTEAMNSHTRGLLLLNP